MRFIMLPLVLLMFSSLLGVARVVGYVDFGGNPFSSDYYNSSGIEYSQTGNLTLNQTESTVSTETASVAISAVVASGVISLVVSSIALAVVSGINVLGSGLSDVSVEAIFKSASLYGLWCLFSVLALLMFLEVPVFGLLLYFVLTLFYSVGVVNSIGGV